ncbi:MAG: DUF4407 domain-containing protein, partial [Marinirhabdus sp.]
LALQYTPTVDALNAEIETLKAEITTKEAEVNALYGTYISEAEGTAGTKKLGKGPVYKEKREKHDTELAALQALRKTNTEKISALEGQAAALSTEYQAKVAGTQPIIDGFDGLMARVNALEKLPWLPSFFIFLLFLAIETSPIIAKLLSPKGPYDLKLAEREGAIKSWVEQQAMQREVLVTADRDLNNRVYTDIAEERELYDYKSRIARKLMQEQATSFYKKQQRVL